MQVATLTQSYTSYVGSLQLNQSLKSQLLLLNLKFPHLGNRQCERLKVYLAGIGQRNGGKLLSIYPVVIALLLLFVVRLCPLQVPYHFTIQYLLICTALNKVCDSRPLANHSPQLRGSTAQLPSLRVPPLQPQNYFPRWRKAGRGQQDEITPKISVQE